jgi:hypothetical protein
MASDDILDVRTLIGGDFVFHSMVAPGLPIIAKDLAEIVMPGGMIYALI